MRIIAGAHRARPLVGPKDQKKTRPITDRVKESLFNVLISAGVFDGEPRVLDVFCGTGSMGLECLSRGAAHVTFVERDRDARRRLEQNLQAFRETEHATVLGVDALRGDWSRRVRGAVDLVFLDPPYAMLREAKTTKQVVDLAGRIAALGRDDAMLVLRSDRVGRVEALPGWWRHDERRYGEMVIGLFRLEHGA